MNTEDTIEERLISLESSRSVLNKIASQQMLHLREIDEHLTILVGVQGSQGQDIKAIKSDIKEMKADVSDVKERLAQMESHIDERFDAVMAILSKMQPPQ